MPVEEFKTRGVGDPSNEDGGVIDLLQHILGLYNSLEGTLDENQNASVRRFL